MRRHTHTHMTGKYMRACFLDICITCRYSVLLHIPFMSELAQLVSGSQCTELGKLRHQPNVQQRLKCTDNMHACAKVLYTLGN